MKIQIIPTPIAFKVEANFIQLRQVGYILGSNDKCRVRVLFFENENLVCDQNVVEIPANLVAGWDEDQTLIDYVINELQLTVVQPEETEI